MKNDYLTTIDENYRTSLKVLEKENPEDEVNSWISDATNGKIDKLYGKCM